MKPFIVISIALLLLPFGFLTSCIESHPPITEISEPSYASEVVEGMLIALNTKDYDKYLSYFYYKEFKTQEWFNDRIAWQQNNLGDYVANSKQFSDASFQWDKVHRIGTTVVDYNVQFTKRRVLVEIAFWEINGKMWVENISFNARGKYYDEPNN